MAMRPAHRLEALMPAPVTLLLDEPDDPNLLLIMAILPGLTPLHLSHMH
jgi:hypothetical protein